MTQEVPNGQSIVKNLRNSSKMTISLFCYDAYEHLYVAFVYAYGNLMIQVTSCIADRSPSSGCICVSTIFGICKAGTAQSSVASRRTSYNSHRVQPCGASRRTSYNSHRVQPSGASRRTSCNSHRVQPSVASRRTSCNSHRVQPCGASRRTSYDSHRLQPCINCTPGIALRPSCATEKKRWA